MIRYINDKGLAALDNYKYKSEDLSILRYLFLGDFWEMVVQCVPLWVAPNLITMVGFISLLANMFVSLYYFTYEIPPPTWLFAMVAFNLFFYQTMDNIDGKQARRTGASSALGELFDHGCDSLFFMTIFIPLSMALGTSYLEAYILVTLSHTAFYSAHWEEYYTDFLLFGTLANPTELQCGMMLGVLSGIYPGPQWWQATRNVGELLSLVGIEEVGHEIDFTMIQFLVFVSVLGVSIAVLINAYTALTKRDKDVHPEPLTASFVLPMAPYAALVFLLGGWIYLSPGEVLLSKEQFVYTVAFQSLQFSFLCNSLVMSRICRLKFPTRRVNYVLVFPLLGFLNTIVLFEGKPIIPEWLAMPAIFWAFLIFYADFILSVVNQLTTYLEIKVFVIPDVEKDE